MSSHDLDKEIADLVPEKQQPNEVDKLFRALVKLQGSDLHLKVGRPPHVRLKGDLKALEHPAVSDAHMRKMLMPMMSDRNKKIYLEEGGADFAYGVEVDGELWRFRVNILNQMGHMGLVARRVNNFIPDFEGLYLPPQLEKLCRYDQGMVLLAGVTGSGKSTTIASMLNWLNRREPVHILTLEDPIEFMFKDDKAICQPARDRAGRQGLQDRHEARGPRRPRLHAGGRDARRRDVHDGHSRGRDRAPGVRHDPRLERRLDHRPHPGPVPAEHAPGPAQRDRLQHARHRGSKAAALDQAGSVASPHRRDHVLQHGRSAS